MPGDPPRSTPWSLVAAGIAAALLAAATLATAVTLLGVATGRAGRAWARLADRLTPAALRRLGEIALGLALTGAPAGVVAATPALAAPPAVAGPAVAGPARAAPPLADSSPGGRTTPPADVLVDRPATGAGLPNAADTGRWLPDRPAAPRARPAPVRLVAAAPRLARARRDSVVVRRGDSLWAIAARHLGPRSSAADVAAEWPRWYAANRAVIGPDPALLQPGQQLRPPAPDA